MPAKLKNNNRNREETMLLSNRPLFVLSLCAGLSLLSSPTFAQNTGAPGGKAPPKLVLFMVVDGFPQEPLCKYYDLYGDRGFKLFLRKGRLVWQHPLQPCHDLYWRRARDAVVMRASLQARGGRERLDRQEDRQAA